MPDFFRFDKWKKIFFGLTFICPIILFFGIFDKYALNIPHWDDFAVRNSIQKITESDSLFHKIELFFAQHNEHRIFFTRLVAFIIFELNDTLNFKYLMVVGNSCLLIILLIYYKIFQKKALDLLYFIPISWLLLTVVLFENEFWGMASIQNFWVITFALLSFYWVIFSIEDEQRTYLYLGLTAASLAVFTSSNGLLVPFLLILVLLFQKRKADVWISLVVIFIIYLLFFVGFEQIPDKNLHASFQPKLILKGFLAVLGSMFDLMYFSPANRVDWAMAFGLLMLIIIGYFGSKVLLQSYHIREKNVDLFLLTALLFFILTAAGTSFGRIAYGIETLMSSKYKIYSFLIFITIYIILLQDTSVYRQKRLFLFIFIFSIFGWVSIYMQNYPAIRLLHHERLTDDFGIYQKSKGIKSDLIKTEYNFLKELVIGTIVVKDSADVIKISESPDGYLFEIDAHGQIFHLDSPESGIFLVLKNDKNFFIFPTRIFPYGKKAFFSFDFLLNNRLKINIFVSEVRKYQVPEGKYMLGKLIRQNRKSSVIWSNQTIDFQGKPLKEVQKNW